MMEHTMEDADRLIIEQHAERRALAMIWGANFTHCLHLHGLAPSIEVIDGKGNKILIRGSDLYDKRTWLKFLTTTRKPGDLCQLTEVVDPLEKHYRQWLLAEHTPRYRGIANSQDLVWFEQVVRLVVLRHIMEHKYSMYLTKQREFADPWVASEMGIVMMLSEITKDAAKLIHRIFKDEQQPQALIEQFYEVHSAHLSQRRGAQRLTLPPLPDHTIMPHALLTEKTREESNG